MLVGLKEILKLAEEDKTAVGMFNATGFDSLQAVIGAAEELNRPVILAHAEVHNVYNDISFVGPAMIAAAQNAKVPVCVHLDHGTSLSMIYRALRIGFTSVMIDASALSYGENLAITRRVTEAAHAMGAGVEAELGRLATGEAGGGETEKDAENVRAEDFYTRPEEAKRFCEAAEVDALAIAFGTAHGFYKAQPKLDFDVVKNTAAATGVPLVMHGGSGVSDEGFRKAIASGIRKINYYSYMSKAGYEAAAKEISSGGSKYLHDVEYAAMCAMKKDVKKAIRIFSER